MKRLAAAVAIVGAMFATGAARSHRVDAKAKPTVCDRFSIAPDQNASLSESVLNEVSGVAASRTQPPLLWVENDSGGAPAVYAIRPDGTLVGTYTVEGATNTDWEDIAVGPGPERNTSYLYVGDIGDTPPKRDHLTVYRVPEPEAPFAPTGTLTGAAVITLRYPDHAVDAESLFVDPRTGDLYVIDKEYLSGVGHVFRVPAPEVVDGADVTLREVASFTVTPDDPTALSRIVRFPGRMVTGADISPDGSTILVRTYRHVLAFSRRVHGSVAAAFRRPPCEAPQIDEPQGEGIGFAADGARYFTVSEGVGAAVHRFAVRPPLRGEAAPRR